MATSLNAKPLSEIAAQHVSATMARAPPGPTSLASVVRKCTTSKRTVLIDLDITRVRDNYKTGNGIDFWRELVIRHAQDLFT